MAAVPCLRPPIFFFFFVFPLLLLTCPLLASSAMSESDALLMLKKSFANSTRLSSWGTGSPPCTEKTTWVGVICVKGVVKGLRLGHMGLSGKIEIDALLNVPGLRTISFVDNEFEGPIPSFNRLGALKAIYLTNNRFAGEIPGDFFSNMASLKKVWLSHNEFSGPIPPSLGKLSHLMELPLENNRFSVVIPPIGPPTLTSFNVSNNELEWSIPENFSEMDSSAFAGNAKLCGDKVGKACDAVPGTRSKLQEFLDAPPRGLALVVVVICLGVVVVSVAGRRRREMEFSRLGRDMDGDDAVVDVSVSSSLSRSRRDPSSSSSVRMRESVRPSRRAGGSDLVMINDEKGVFGLQDLMKAAAEVLGTGVLGSSYKAVLGNGLVVVVKRMREMNALGNDGFDAEMKKLGRLRHKNLLPPLAFHFRREEKLLIYEYVSKGSFALSPPW